MIGVTLNTDEPSTQVPPDPPRKTHMPSPCTQDEGKKVAEESSCNVKWVVRLPQEVKYDITTLALSIKKLSLGMEYKILKKLSTTSHTAYAFPCNT